MTDLLRILERNQAANLLVMQGFLRVSGLTSISMLSALNKALDTYLVCLRYGAALATDHTGALVEPKQFATGYIDAITECVERSWQDFRNHTQIMLLTQDEALIWMARIDQALLAD